MQNPCRVYTDLVRGGIKPENIIYMTYTTDLTSSQNPYPGKIFTEPADNLDGDWAQYGCFDHVDYTSTEISAKVFAAILKGDAETVKQLTDKENPKVLSAGPEDTLFTYFIDHGNTDLIQIGHEYANSEALLRLIQTAHDNQLYGKWVWFMETCHSGSMFTKLPSNLNVYVMTSADAENNAAMTHCPPDDIVAGTALDTCLGGLWDNIFLDYVEQHPDCTIGELFDAVKASVAQSSQQNVSEFGDLSFRDSKVAEFFGELPVKAAATAAKAANSAESVDTSEVPLHLAKWRAIRAEESGKSEALLVLQREVALLAKQEVEVMRLGRALMSEKAADKAMKQPAGAFAVDCVRELSRMLVERCGQKVPFAEKENNMLRNICLPGLRIPTVDWDEICM